jgi:hypothetical protein
MVWSHNVRGVIEDELVTVIETVDAPIRFGYGVNPSERSWVAAQIGDRLQSFLPHQGISVWMSVSALEGALISDKWVGRGRLQCESFEGTSRDLGRRRGGAPTDGEVGIEVGARGIQESRQAGSATLGSEAGRARWAR